MAKKSAFHVNGKRSVAFEFKCRRCDEVEHGPNTGEGNGYQTMIRFLSSPERQGSGHTVGLLQLHHCKDGNLGLSDLIGCVVVE